jgi:hypothetical protein
MYNVLLKKKDLYRWSFMVHLNLVEFYPLPWGRIQEIKPIDQYAPWGENFRRTDSGK